MVWPQEITEKSADPFKVKYSICCSKGNVQLPLLKDAPAFLQTMMDYKGGQQSTKFRRLIRLYNSMFAFTSSGGRQVHEVNKGGGPYVYKIQGSNYHIIGSLLPVGEIPAFAQFYVYDADIEREANLRRNVFVKAPEGNAGSSKKHSGDNVNNDEFDIDVIKNLISMFDEHNEVAKAFRMARDRFRETDVPEYRMRLIGNRAKDPREYNLPTCSEIAGLFVRSSTDKMDQGEKDEGFRDIIVEHKKDGYTRIDETHPCYMPMQFPILFPYGEDGYTENIFYKNPKVSKNGKLMKRQTITMREYYAYRLQQRTGEGQTLIRGGRLLQQYVVDAYACLEEYRLRWVRNNQPTIRAELYSGLKDALLKGDTDGGSNGKKIVLPSTFTGSPRYMMEHYQDAIAICRCKGIPDLFVTFTCNPKWSEIQIVLDKTPGQRAEDRPDIVSRVFNLKLKELMKSLREKKHFGTVIAAIYTIEFQKRGLPHAHILLWLDKKDKPQSPSEIDRIISAEIPDKEKDPDGHKAVVQFMLHGPCGISKPDQKCMRDNKCSKHYPKEFNSQTTVDDNGYPVYRRRKNNVYAHKDGVDFSNQWVIPHNRC